MERRGQARRGWFESARSVSTGSQVPAHSCWQSGFKYSAPVGWRPCVLRHARSDKKLSKQLPKRRASLFVAFLGGFFFFFANSRVVLDKQKYFCESQFWKEKENKLYMRGLK